MDINDQRDFAEERAVEADLRSEAEAELAAEAAGDPAYAPCDLVVGETYTRAGLGEMFPGATFIGWPEDEDADDDLAWMRSDVDGPDRNGVVDGFGQVHSDAEDGL